MKVGIRNTDLARLEGNVTCDLTCVVVWTMPLGPPRLG